MTRDQRGSVAVELVWLGVMAMVPMVYIVVTVFTVQQGAFATAGAARAAARAYALAPDDATGESRARAAAAAVFADHGIDGYQPQVSVSCESPGECHSGGSVITVSVQAAVPLPLVPDLLGEDRAVFPVTARHTVPIGRYVEVGP